MIKILFTILFISQIHATELKQCVFEASNYALFVGSGEVSKDCDKVIENHSNELSSFEINDQSKIFGYKNILYFKKDEKLSIFAGNMTQLEDIQAISFNKDDNTIYVLDRHNGILAFHSFLAGNVAPIRKIQNEQTDQALDIEYFNGKIHVLSSNKLEVSLFDAMASDRNNNAKKVEKTKLIKLDHPIEKIKIKE